MANDDTLASVSPLIPTELLIAVLTGQLDEAEAIERGRRAARAKSEQERRRILFDGPQVPATAETSAVTRPCWRPLNPPWGEP